MISRWQLDCAVKAIDCGGVIAYPTESVFGLGCDPYHNDAIKKILSIKKRPAYKGLIILVSDIAQAEPFLQPLSKQQLQRVNIPRERAITWLIPCQPEVSPLLRGHFRSLAVRITQHPIARAICESTNTPLVSTSCNIAGKSELKTTMAVRNHMKAKIDWLVDGKCGGQAPSQIIDITNDRVLRH
ncbi:L-threonylcarbamoyladenylate synthase [Aliikangiella sp. IMCC44359]|uniref:L-threonylcarbamoyladenylate synthase n=1 Tax=Aliikangiella sp. IMCC44359 TaxID=3459125 RepID=UPI00403B1B14